MHVKRAFLLGDAAHIHSPFGAQGMNTGLQDAWNLAWKLAAVIKGIGPTSLLHSFARERLRVARDVLRQTDAITRVMASSNPVVNALRETVLPRVGRTRFFERAFTQTLSEIAVNYAHSPIVHGDGARVTQESLGITGPRGLLDRYLSDGKFVVVSAGADDPTGPGFAAVDNLRQPFGDAIAVAHAAQASRSQSIDIVRPDGYRAGRFGFDELPAAVALLRSQLIARTTDAAPAGARR